MSGAHGYNPATGLMDFARALRSLEQGGKVRRDSWPPRCYVVKRSEKLRMSTPHWGDMPYRLCNDDLFAKDWDEFRGDPVYTPEPGYEVDAAGRFIG